MRYAIPFAACVLSLGMIALPVETLGQTGEVVQPLPSRNVAALNQALQRLAHNPQSVDALLSAGTAALELGDIDAAIGFFGRADELSPGNPRAKLGMAAGFLRSERPVEALRLFTEAERAGVSSDRLSGDRGLAYDLVGDTAHAQEEYRKLLARRNDPEVVRRLALSQAISGNRKGFEQTLLPLLERRDLAAYRTRAFALAILGEAEEAQRIVDAVMPQSMANQLTPYLKFMPQLTKAQQAAAANLGRFPQAGLIGQDDPRLAQYSRSASRTVGQADASLTPQGPSLDTPTPVPAPRTVSQPVTQQIAGPPARPAPSSASQLDRVISRQVAAPSATEAQPETVQPNVSIAFSSFERETGPRATAQRGAVDITTIEPKREVAPPPPPAHPKRIWVQVATGQDLSALKFDWRRLARNAPDELGRFTPHTVPWGQANRLLAGPYASEVAAQSAVNALKEKGIDTFSYTSPEGQAIAELD